MQGDGLGDEPLDLVLGGADGNAAGLAGHGHRAGTVGMTKLAMGTALPVEPPSLPLEDLDHLPYLHPADARNRL